MWVLYAEQEDDARSANLSDFKAHFSSSNKAQPSNSIRCWQDNLQRISPDQIDDDLLPSNFSLLEANNPLD